MSRNFSKKSRLTMFKRDERSTALSHSSCCRHYHRSLYKYQERENFFHYIKSRKGGSIF